MPTRFSKRTSLFLNKWMPLAAVTLALAGCAGPQQPSSSLHIDDSIRSISHSSRVRYIVLHYTSADSKTSLKLLSQGRVSSHYLITDDTRPHVYRLVDETRSSWHAGESQWYKQVSLNAVSIGIELVNPGRTDLANGQKQWAPYSPAQIQTLTVLLKELTVRYGIRAENIVGHSDIAPQRKTDPGPLFPWKHLAKAGVGRWYNEAQAATNWVALQRRGTPDIAWFQSKLTELGYACPQHGQLDRETQNVLAAFQMHYRPSNYDGKPDAETAAIMMALLETQH